MSAFMTKSLKKVLGAVAVAATLAGTTGAYAAGGAEHPKHVDFSFKGPFGTFDQGQLQRGYKVYKEVCANCHSATLMSFRNLAQKGGPFYDPKYKNPNDNPVVKAIAAEFEVPDIDTDTGEDITRPATPSDNFPEIYPNSYAAAAGNGGAIPPDLSVITKARHGGAEYIYSLLTGYVDPPKGLSVGQGQYYNPYMPGSLATQWEGDPKHVPAGGVLAMAPPLNQGAVTYDDGTPETVDNYAKDVSAFLQWAGDPHTTLRKKTGVAVLIYLFLFGTLTYFAYRQLWHGKH